MTDRGGAPLEYVDQKPAVQELRREVLAGLARMPKALSPKFFYDARGSRLFEAITRLPEYYLTRTELAIFDVCLPAIAAHLEPPWCLVEYGAGSTLKVRKLLETLRPRAYVPVDISAEHLYDGAVELDRDHPDLLVLPTAADFTHAFELPAAVEGLARVGFFPGSSIGNFTPALAREFLGHMATTLGHGAVLLIGVDRKKDAAVLEAAYDDPAGVTAAFNLNMLRHLNALVGTNFDESGFRHRARYDGEAGCIRMYLESVREQLVTLDDRSIRFARGERIHTENSYKYDHDEFVALAAGAGLVCIDSWSDSRDWFSVFLLGCVGPAVGR
jgi:dimethylhistidine N-methyltransferase